MFYVESRDAISRDRAVLFKSEDYNSAKSFALLHITGYKNPEDRIVSLDGKKYSLIALYYFVLCSDGGYCDYYVRIRKE